MEISDFYYLFERNKKNQLVLPKKYQRRMFDQAVQLVRPGGIIVYST